HQVLELVAARLTRVFVNGHRCLRSANQTIDTKLSVDYTKAWAVPVNRPVSARRLERLPSVMAEEDFNIETLADYLHLEANQVSRLAERGKLPGRRIGGAWRFSRAEIHHWLENRIGLS